MSSTTLELVRACIATGEVRISRHGSQELDDDGINVDEVLESGPTARVIEDYASAQRGPSVLALHRMRDGRAVHVVWAFIKETKTPAVLVTAYRPDPTRWSHDLVRRQR